MQIILNSASSIVNLRAVTGIATGILYVRRDFTVNDLTLSVNSDMSAEYKIYSGSEMNFASVNAAYARGFGTLTVGTQPYALTSVGYAPVKVNTSATILSGTSVSETIECSDRTLLGFVAPAGWTAAALNLEASLDGLTWVTSGLFDAYGSAVNTWGSITPSAGYCTDINSTVMWKFLRLRSGTAAAPVVQGADRVFSVITRGVV
jgi:hypothetical protein